jgi:heme-degrading monooxygenase HmoA
MHARITSVDIQQGKINEAIRTYQEVVLKATAQEPGYRGAILFIDRDTHRAISITIWDSEDEMTAGEISTYYIEQLRKMAAYFAAMPVRESFEVAVFDTSGMPDAKG